MCAHDSIQSILDNVNAALIKENKVKKAKKCKKLIQSTLSKLCKLLKSAVLKGGISYYGHRIITLADMERFLYKWTTVLMNYWHTMLMGDEYENYQSIKIYLSYHDKLIAKIL